VLAESGHGCGLDLVGVADLVLSATSTLRGDKKVVSCTR
jgi:hypothetical protein